MRFLKSTLLILLAILICNVSALQKTTSYQQKFFYTCKIWGFYKYFHTEVAKGPATVNWNDALLAHLAQITPETTDEQYYQSLTEMLNKAGIMAEPTTQLPVLPDSLKPNLDLNWLNDSFITAELKTKLFTIKDKFRPQLNFYIKNFAGIGNPILTTDNAYTGGSTLPTQQLRLLALARYWNIINYFYPYKKNMDQNWDSTLVEMIPCFSNCATAGDYGKAVLKLSARLNDTHGFVDGTIINNLLGVYYIPIVIKRVENKILITHKLLATLDIEPGDLLLEINDRPVDVLRDSLRQLSAASNNSVMDRVVNDYLLRGKYEPVQFKVEDKYGNQKTINCTRNISMNGYFTQINNLNPVKWSKITDNGKSIGYINMAKLLSSDISAMFTELWDTDGLIFDVRNYPNGTLWDLVNYLFSQDLPIANFTNPDESYPGTIGWDYEILSVNPTSLGTYNKKIAIVFNEETQSQAEYTVMGLEKHPGAIKVGSQTAGADGNVSSFYLPGALLVYFTGLGTYYPDGTATQRIGIIPDIDLRPTIAGIRAGKDELLEAALQTVDIKTENKPLELVLLQNYPNPFNPTTRISYSLLNSGKAQLSVYNTKGELVKTLVSGMQNDGRYSVTFDGVGFNSGLYFYKLEAGGMSMVKRMLMVK